MDSTARRIIDAGILSVGVSSLYAAAVGLPLYGDGALYFVEIILEEAPLFPNARYSAMLPQLPVLLATASTDDVTLLRHAFSLGYAALPFLSLLVCWLLVRHTRPQLILFPALFLVANQVNFSAVSELVMSLYLAWPFAFLATLYPNRSVTWVYGLVVAPTLVFLHPFAFAVLILLGFMAWKVGRRADVKRGPWARMAALFTGLGLARLLWSAVGLNEYERSRLQLDSAINYLFPDTWAQNWLLVAVVLAAVALAIRPGHRSGSDPRADSGPAAEPPAASVERVLPGSRRSGLRAWVTWLTCVAVAVLGLAVAVEVSAGEGVELKSGVTFFLALFLMAIAFFSGTRADGPRSPRQSAILYLLFAATTVTMASAKASIWSQSTVGLMEALANAPEACVPFGPEQPPGLQYPYMTPVDNWTAPMNALVFRAAHPIPLLLPNDGCQKLADTGIAYLTPWFGRPRLSLEHRFGPLRHP